MSGPLVIRQALAFKDALQRREDAQMREMERHWDRMVRRLQDKIDALSEEVAQARASGQIIAEEQARRLRRYQELLVEVQAETARYEAWAQGRILEWEREAARLGAEEAARNIRAAGIRSGFGTLNASAVENMVALTREGGAVFDLLRERALFPAAERGLNLALRDAITTGKGPMWTASCMADGLEDGRRKAQTIARTEQLRVLRQATQAQYAESEVVRAWRRMSARDGRVCAGCLAADGREYTIGHIFDAHPNCRCTLYPVLVGVPAPERESAEVWLAKQSQYRQRDILGPGRWELWHNGQIAFSDLAKTTYSPIWGGAIVPRTIEELESLAGQWASRRRAA